MMYGGMKMLQEGTTGIFAIHGFETWQECTNAHTQINQSVDSEIALKLSK